MPARATDATRSNGAHVRERSRAAPAVTVPGGAHRDDGAPITSHPAVRSDRLATMLTRSRVERAAAAGGCATSAVLARTATIGQPGMNPVTHSTLTHAGNLLAPAVAGFANAPGWLAAWMQPHLDAIVTGQANYALDTAGELGRWIVLRELLAELRTLLSTPGNAGVTLDGRRARRLYQVIEAERANYAAAGLASAQYTFLGHTYQLQNQGANHYYASRNGHNIEYSADFTRKDALDVLKHFVQTPNVPYAHATDVDNFICAFFAEPTRWPEEQVLNTLAIMRKGADADKIVSTNAGALPMAGGTTWDVGHGTLGRETPKRALDHATREGRFFIIDQEIVTAPNWGAFVTAVEQQLLLIP